MLRQWQDECIHTALLKYQLGQTNFLAMATPGAGKTHMAAHLTSRLFELDKIDLVVCFTPSVSVTNSFQSSLESVTSKKMNGKLGSSGQVLTYHHLSFLSNSFWQIFNQHRVFVIFDEIHHCGGQDINLSNVWGEKILRNIRSRAAYTLALSGTPWRSDKLPIALAHYSGDPSRLQCDYTYSLAQAISDKVCRTPKVVAIDNNHIHYTDSAGQSTNYNNIQQLLANTDVSYSDLLCHETIVTYILKQAMNRLQRTRQLNPRAAGLIVASSVSHAYWIRDILFEKLKQKSVIVTHGDSSSHATIKNFECSDAQWIIAIGMISEGTNIPRLQVCCYLSRVKTELYFRQVLGRIVRSRDEKYRFAYLYTLAEETLLDYAKRIGEDLPGELTVVEIHQMDDATGLQEPIKINEKTIEIEPKLLQFSDSNITMPSSEGVDNYNNSTLNESSTETVVNRSHYSLSGQFSEELITLHNAFNEAC